MSAPRSKDDWEAYLAPHFSTSIEDVSEALMRTDAVQTWLREASTDAAENLGPGAGMRGEMEGYIQLKNALEDRFPALVDAVDALTEGCGEVDLDWRPLNPTQSHVEVVFDREFPVELFVRLTDLTPEAARRAVQTVADALPEGTPFPNRPNTVTGLVGHEGACVGVRAHEHLGDDQQRRYRTVTLLPEHRDALDKLSEQEAANRLRQLLAPTDSSSAV